MPALPESPPIPESKSESEEEPKPEPLEIDFSIGTTDCTHVNGIPTNKLPRRSELLNRTEFLPIKEVFSKQFRKKLTKEFPKVKHNWHVRCITGENFDLKHMTAHWKQIPKSTDYVVFVFKRFEGDTGDFKLFQCKFGGLCHRIVPNPSKFMDHMRSHTKDRPFACPYPGCTKAFS